jgi:hypothetical protein
LAIQEIPLHPLRLAPSHLLLENGLEIEITQLTAEQKRTNTYREGIVPFGS